MAIEKTGLLTLSWSPIIGSEEYDVHVYENSQFSFSQTQTATNIDVSGLGEGDSVYASVYSLSGFLRSLSGVDTASQTIPVSNFHNSGKTFEFNSFVLDGINLNFVSDGHAYYATGNYQNKNSLLEFEVVNPRDTAVLTTFDEEPFLSGIWYQTYDDNSLNYNSGSLYSFSVSVPNNTSSRNYNTKIEVTDYYGSGITGFLDLNNEAISMPSVKLSSEAISTGNGTFSIIPAYSRPPTGLEYVVSRDEGFTDLLFSGVTSSTYNFTGMIPTSTTGYISLTPYDWFGSGHKIIPSDSIYINNTGFEITDSILEFQMSQDGNSDIILSFDATTGNPSGHYFTFSIDPSSTGAFNSSFSYDTGYLYSTYFSGETSNSGHLFNYFDNRTGTHETFYGTLNLYQSGSNVLADTATDSVDLPYPKFISSGVYFDYINGVTELSFTTEPSYLFTGVDILFSGQGSSSYITYSGDNFNTGSLYPSARVKVVKASDNSISYDSLQITGSGELPIIRTRGIDFISIEGTINTTLLKDNDVPVDFVQVYRKPAFNVIEDSRSGVLPESFSGILNFNDFTGGQVLVSGFSGGQLEPSFTGSGYSGGFLYENTILGHYLDKPPVDIAPSQEYSHTGVGFTGYYESGRHYLYRFVPYNGYGSGHITSPEVFKFNVNEIAQGTENTTINNTTNIDIIQNKYIVFSGNKEFKGNIELDPISGCLALDVQRNVKISGWTGDSSTSCAYALDVAGNTIISGYQGNNWRESCYGTGSGHSLTVLGHSRLSGNATVGTGENIVFEVLSGRSNFYHDLYVSGGNLTVSGNDARIRVDGITDSVPGYEIAENSVRKWVIYNHYTDDNLNFKTNSDIRMSIEQGGNVGIGTESPDYKLDVAGDIGVDQYIYHNGDSNTHINFTDDDINIKVGGVNMIDFTEDSVSEITIYEASQNLDVRIEGEADPNLFFTDGSVSNIGIGTSSPSHKLEVVGSISGTSAVFGGLSPALFTGSPPTSDSSNGVSGQLGIDENYLYVCIRPNKWGRISLDTGTG